MTSAARDLADRLLDAQVEFVLAELHGERLAEVIADGVDDVLAAASRLVLADVVDEATIAAIGRRMVSRLATSPMVEDLVGALAEELHAMAASDEHELGAVVAREPVEDLVSALLRLGTLQDRALDRLAESPAVAVVASTFVTKIITDFVAQNRARAEKLPGMSSMLSLGTSAANRLRSPFDRQLNALFGDATERGAQFALRQTNSAVRDTMADAPVHDAVMEIWDLHAGEPVGELREYLSAAELRELALLVHAVVVSGHDSEWTGAVVDTCVAVFFARWGDRDLRTLLAQLGIERDDVVADLQQIVPPVVDALTADGTLAALVRQRLEPFFRSEAVLAMLEPSRPRPTKKA